MCTLHTFGLLLKNGLGQSKYITQRNREVENMHKDTHTALDLTPELYNRELYFK